MISTLPTASVCSCTVRIHASGIAAPVGLPGFATKTIAGSVPAKPAGSSRAACHCTGTGTWPFICASIPAAGHPGSTNRMVVDATARINESSTPVPPAPVVTCSVLIPSRSATASVNRSA